MNKKTKRFLITTLSAATLTCGAIGWATNPDKQKIVSAETSTTAISLVDGAACRIRTANDIEQGSGIRFKAVLDRTQWTALAESNEMIAGIMILPTDYITEAGGYTHSALDTARKNYLDLTYTEDEVGEQTVLAASMVDILDQNYTRDFSGVAYLKSTTAFEGATEYNGAYYAYAEYTEENNSRSIYEIATGAYNDRKDTKVTTDYEYSVTYNEKTSYSPYTDDQREVLKGYLDGVVDIKKNAYADVFVTNNTEYYTSPYTIEKRSNAEFIVNYDLSVTAKGMLYKGKRVKSLSVKEGKTSISLTDRVVFSANTDKNYDGTVTMPARQTGGGNKVSTIAAMDADYIAFEGNYGIGTYVDFTFTGNNMPQVMFFADEINGNMTETGGTGVICMNGLTIHEGNSDFSRCTDYLVFGPNRINSTSSQPNYENGQQIATILSTGTTANPGDYPLLSQTGLRKTPDTKYAYTVGTYEGTNGYLYMDIYLSYADTDELIYHIEKKTNLKVANMTVTSGNIVAYTCWKGSYDTETTTFGYGMPYTLELTIPNSGATLNMDGSVTLVAGNTGTGTRNGVFKGSGYGSGVSPYKNSYIAWEEDYGVGTCVEFTFTGNNMPQVMLFANEINDSMGCGYQNYGYLDSKGYLIGNGFVACKAGVKTAWYANWLHCFGPKRISASSPLTTTATNFTFESGKEYTALDDAITYKYVVWSEVNASGTVDIRVELINTSDDSVVVDGTYATNKTQDEVQAYGGKIIAYAGVKGEVGVEVGTETTTPKAEGISTTFAYSQPYTKEQEDEEETEETEAVLYNGVTVNADGSVTLAGKQSATAGWESGLHAMNNSYIAYNGEYILGTEVAFTFTGNNLPQVMLFADEINGDMSKLGGAGILLMNGLYVKNKPSGADSNYLGENKLVCFGPNRVYNNYYTLAVEQSRCDVSFESGYAWVALDDNTDYKYVVWTEETDGTIVVCVELYNAVTSELLSKGSFATGVGVNDIAAGAIVAYATVKGSGNDTTFFCHEPKMHEDTISFYTYGAPGTYTTETDLTTEAVLKDYVDSGMNMMMLGGNNAYSGKNWATSKTKSVMATARAVGVEKFIINDNRIYSALCITESLIGEGCKFASEAELDHYVANCIMDYVNEEGFYGVILRDEPSYEYATSIGQLYRSIKRVAEVLNTEIYVQLNLLPMASNAQAHYKATPTDSLYNDYVDYLNLFLNETGADMICVDKYPFMNSGFLDNYYSTYKALADACKEHGAEFGFILQSWTHESAKTVSQEEMNLQMNAALAFGAKDIAFFTYVPDDGGTNASSSFVDINGIKTEVYDYAQNAINGAKEVEKLLADYEYVGASISDKSKDGAFADDTFAKLTYTATAWTVVTESYNAMTGSYLYTAVGAAASTVEMTFTGYTQAYVVVNGVGSIVDLTNGVYVATLALGEAVHIIPLA